MLDQFTDEYIKCSDLTFIKICYQANSPSNDHQSGMPHCIYKPDHLLSMDIDSPARQDRKYFDELNGNYHRWTWEWKRHVIADIEGILPKGPYLLCISMVHGWVTVTTNRSYHQPTWRRPKTASPNNRGYHQLAAIPTGTITSWYREVGNLQLPLQ